jgi:DHA1 family bicyclomycin/chloramphenicol resistance-like MFS transporter
LGALSTFGPLSLDLYLPGLPDMARDLDASASAGQLTLTACLVGLAAGQLLAGPISDARGRRGPLLIGLGMYVIASGLCALSPSVVLLILVRFLQGLAGAAGIVIARAIVRDLYAGIEAARMFATLLLVNGLAPIVAPILGGQLLHVTDWRGVFVVLSAIGWLLLVWAWRGVGETNRDPHGGGLAATRASFAVLLRDPAFVGIVLSAGLAFGAMFAYIAGSPFVLEERYGVTPQGFSVIFACNGLGIMAASRMSRVLVDRVGPARLFTAGVVQSMTGGIALLLVHLAGGGLWALLPCLFVVVSAIGLVVPNGTALAMDRHPERSGAASGFVGLAQFAIGALAAPLVAGSEASLSVVIAVLGTMSVGLRLTTRGA